VPDRRDRGRGGRAGARAGGRAARRLAELRRKGHAWDTCWRWLELAIEGLETPATESLGFGPGDAAMLGVHGVKVDPSPDALELAAMAEGEA
jgi:hypothetical protein